MTIRVRGGWCWCERKRAGLWEMKFVESPNLDEGGQQWQVATDTY